MKDSRQLLPLEVADLREARAAALGLSRYSTVKIETSSSSRRTSRLGGSSSKCSSVSCIGGRSGTGLWLTVHRPSPAASTDSTFRHQRGSLSGSATTAQTASDDDAISIDSSTRMS
jgi:hypothetical protein